MGGWTITIAVELALIIVLLIYAIGLHPSGLRSSMVEDHPDLYAAGRAAGFPALKDIGELPLIHHTLTPQEQLMRSAGFNLSR
jgi:hypothetical protein